VGSKVSEAKRLKALEEENCKLKKLLAEQMLDAATLREMLAKTSDAPSPTTGRWQTSPAAAPAGGRAASLENAEWRETIRSRAAIDLEVDPTSNRIFAFAAVMPRAPRVLVPALLSPSHTRRRGRIYRYYVTREAIADGYDSCAVTSVPAADVEGAVLDHVQKLLAAPELVARRWSAAKREDDAISEREVNVLLAEFATLWNELFPAEQRDSSNSSSSVSTCERTRSRCGLGPRGWQAWSGSCGSSVKGWRHDPERRDTARRHHARRAHPHAIPAPRRTQAHRRAGR
jgi:hypothetical protein